MTNDEVIQMITMTEDEKIQIIESYCELSCCYSVSASYRELYADMWGEVTNVYR